MREPQTSDSTCDSGRRGFCGRFPGVAQPAATSTTGISSAARSSARIRTDCGSTTACSCTAGRPVLAWPFTIDGKAAAVRVSGNREANDGGVLRHRALQGYGVIIKNALEDLASPAVDFYAVTAGGAPSHRVAVLIDVLAEALRPDGIPGPAADRGSGGEGRLPGPTDQALR